mmetsp:Transcript_48669/g.155744  ORF Transcript_48669/g.155744 Transcript_48669/m.155744 type:complete len:300 (-) Transcript_48669:554-1453(-)
MTMHAAARLPRAPPPSLRGCRVLRARGGSLLAARGVGRGVPSAASRLMVSCQVVAVTESYEALCDEHCITREVVLRKGGPCGRGVFASRDFSPGDVLLSVDLSQCLVAARGDVPAISTPTATWDELASSGGWRRLGEWAASPYTDEDEHIFFSLALALIDSKHRAPGAGLWGQYSAYLPAPGTLTTPVCLPPPLVAELQDPVMASRTAEQTERLAALCPNGGAHCGPLNIWGGGGNICFTQGSEMLRSHPPRRRPRGSGACGTAVGTSLRAQPHLWGERVGCLGAVRRHDQPQLRGAQR